MTDDLHNELAALRDQGLLRQLRTLPECGARIRLADGRVVLNLSSNDYLGLADDPRVKAGAIAAVERLGCSARASRLMAGDLELCEQLEATWRGWLAWRLHWSSAAAFWRTSGC